MSNGEDQSIDDKALDAIVNAYYPQVLGAARLHGSVPRTLTR
jgi:hypothetical protein